MEADLIINGDSRTVTAPPDADLASVLRQEGFTGVKCGCDGGVCGASKVLIDDEAKMACGMDFAEAAGSSILTIEGLGSQDDLHPIQQAFVDHFAVQCGFCTPGMIIQAVELLESEPDPTEAQVRDAISDNYCRCTGYQKPVAAILDAAGRLRGEQQAVADGGVSTTDSTTSNGETND